MAKKHVNENYIHDCGSTKVAIKDFITSVVDMGFSKEQVLEILDFYLFHAAVLKSNKKDSGFGLKSMKDYGWAGNSEINKLEGRLLKASGISVFCFIKADSIAQTLEMMDLGEKICIQHPRAVIKQDCSSSIQEDGSITISQHETRMECLFRHIRNSLAHNHTYLFDNGNIMIEDCNDTGNVTARILMPKQALLDWMNVIKKIDEVQVAENGKKLGEEVE